MYFTNFAMPLDVVRHENDVTLRLDVPGIDREQIEVTVDRGILTISGKRQEERAENDKFFVRERRMGTFTRRMRLPENLNAERGRGQLRQWRPRGPDPGPGAGQGAQDRGPPGGRSAGARRLTNLSRAH